MFEIFIIVICFVISYLIFYLKYFYTSLNDYPKGPKPIPFLGNIYALWRSKYHPLESLNNFNYKYGPVYTIWLGNRPIVVIHDFELAKKALNSSAFSGRPQIPFIKSLCNEKGTDILFSDYGKSWRFLRNITHSAVRKYATNDKFTFVNCQIVDEIAQLMLELQGTDQLFCPNDYIKLTVHNVICYSIFGTKYKFDDPEFLSLNKLSQDIFDLGNKALILQFAPILVIFSMKQFSKSINFTKRYKKYMEYQYKRHKKTYEEGVIRDFTDSLIASRNEAILKNKDSAPYLSNYSLLCSLWDLLFAGVDTTQITLQWIFLFLANYPKIQMKLRQEIKEVIGERNPQFGDINTCHYVNAFISETLRFRPVLPFGVIHKTVQEIDLVELKIPSNTSVVIHQHSIMNNSKMWNEPNIFRPERFLINNKYVKPTGFIPFSIGQRKCLGEKLALSNLFVILVRFLQRTEDYEIALPSDIENSDCEPDPNTGFQFQYPKPYKIRFLHRGKSFST